MYIAAHKLASSAALPRSSNSDRGIGEMKLKKQISCCEVPATI